MPHTAEAKPVAVDLPITLGKFVKLAGWATTGGDAKHLVTAGLVRVNAEVEKRRGHKLAPGDIVEVHGMTARVEYRQSAREPQHPQSRAEPGAG